MLYSLLCVCIGGAIGAVLRYTLSLYTAAHGGLYFPYGTIIVNLIGSFLIGLLMAYCNAHTQLPPQFKLFFITGCLGGLTTFSTFQYEWFQLFQSAAFTSFFFYGAIQIIGGFLLCWLGAVLGYLYLG